MEGTLAELKASRRALDPERFRDLKSQTFHRLRRMLDRGKLAIPPDAGLWEELFAHRLRVRPDGRVEVGGKDGVIDELYSHGYQLLFASLDAVPETDDTIADLRAVAAAYRSFARQYPMYYEIMFGKFDPSEQSVEIALEGLARFVGRVERGVANGSVRLPDDLDQVPGLPKAMREELKRRLADSRSPARTG